jgi:glycosyltransferase involved in cell wall biosynthesis
VATAISGVLDVIEPGKNGLLVPPAKPTLMAEAVLCLLRDPGLRISLSRAALTTVRESFSWEEISRKYLDRYAALSSGSAL